MVFNILLVDPSKPNVVTQGPLDAILLKNSIAIFINCPKFSILPAAFFRPRSFPKRKSSQGIM